MSHRLFVLVILFAEQAAWAGQELPRPLITGLKNPAAIAVGPDGRVYISEIGESGKDQAGRILVLDKTGQAVPFATGLENPQGMISWQNRLFVTDKNRVWRIDDKGKALVFAAKEAFPIESLSLCGIAVDETGILYVADEGDLTARTGAIYRIDHQGKVKLVADSRRIPTLKSPRRLVMDGLSHLLVLDATSGELLRIRISDGRAVKITGGFDGGDGLAWDWFGQLFITSLTQGEAWGIARPGQPPVKIGRGFTSPGQLCLDPTGNVLMLDGKAGTLTPLPTTIAGNEVDARPMALAPVPAFPNLKWTGWQGETEQGKAVELRPVFLTHAGDGSNRNFVTIQQGIIHVFPGDPKAQKTKIFLDIHDKVFYSDNQNEQGLLGLAFHPNYKNNGEFFVFYTVRKPRLTNVISRFRVSKDDPDKADPASEEELFRVQHPFWNHDGGTICFGPDGYLYVALGDGGDANDPFKNGQNPGSLLGKVLRIDVDRREAGKRYGIPKDNPFAGAKGFAPEIWTYGMRNPWRIAFDRKTGWLWAGDVGQNLYEEIDILEKGGNYGWNIREGLHPFGADGVGPRKDLTEPIWEYCHDIGKSITGGTVYRGKRLPELEGHYVYGDYVSRRIWALKYDEAKKRIVANRPLGAAGLAIFSFGEDEQGEVYLLGPSLTGQSIFRFEAASGTASDVNVNIK
jgi:glucose/arabinose dehydrogenase